MKKVLVSALVLSMSLSMWTPMAMADSGTSRKPGHVRGAQSPAPAPTAPAPAAPVPEPAAVEARVAAVVVEGNKEVPVNEIMSQVNVKIGDQFDQQRLARDVQAIYDLGYFTDAKVETEAMPGGIKVIYRVVENPRVNKIEITGNSLVATDKLLGLMETKEGKVLNTKTLYADVTVINRYYDNELGYLLDPTHVVDLKMQPDGTLKLQIVEGLVVKDVAVTGNTVFPASSIKPLIKTRAGDLFNQNLVKEDTSRIAKLYEDNDYILDTIKPSINKDTGTVTYNILEATVQEIRVEGNTKTQEQVILRNIRTKPGEVLRKKKLQKDLERLNNLGFFESASFEPEPGSAPGKVILVAKVKEAKTGLATLGLGYSGGGNGALRAGVTGAISFSEKNFHGKGQTASFQWQRGVNIDSLGLSYYDPAINPRQDSFGFNLFSQTLAGLEQPIPGATAGSVAGFALYDDHRVGGSVTFGRLLGEDFRGFVTFKKENVSITQNSQSQFTPIGQGTGDSNSIGLAALWDTRDDVFNPHSGRYLNAGVIGAGGPLGGNFGYTKLQAEYRHYFPFKKGSTLAMRLWGGTIAGVAPVTEFFFLGGTDTLRGYQDNSLFGTSFFLANTEYRFPIAKLKLLSGAVFAEAGNASFAGQVNNPGLLSDVGAGLRLVYPTLGLGVIRLDYAIGQQGSRSSVGIGQSF